MPKRLGFKDFLAVDYKPGSDDLIKKNAKKRKSEEGETNESAAYDDRLKQKHRRALKLKKDRNKGQSCQTNESTYPSSSKRRTATQHFRVNPARYQSHDEYSMGDGIKIRHNTDGFHVFDIFGKSREALSVHDNAKDAMNAAQQAKIKARKRN